MKLGRPGCPKVTAIAEHYSIPRALVLRHHLHTLPEDACAVMVGQMRAYGAKKKLLKAMVAQEMEVAI